MQQPFDTRTSVLQMSLVALLLYVVTDTWLFLLIIGLLLFCALANVSVVDLLARGWNRLLMLVSSFNSKVLLSLMFFLFLTPYAFFYRLLNGQATRRFLGLDTAAPSDWKAPDTKVGSRESFERLW